MGQLFSRLTLQSLPPNQNDEATQSHMQFLDQSDELKEDVKKPKIPKVSILKFMEENESQINGDIQRKLSSQKQQFLEKCFEIEVSSNRSASENELVPLNQ